MPDTISDPASSATDDIKASAAQAANGAAEQLDAKRRGAARVVRNAAGKLGAAADYLDEHDAGAMMGDVKTLIRNNPVPALIGAAAIGFLLARSLSR
ncbi:MAG TPA: hypothetical protein VMF03_01930 [Steroidobacteraceae bacterium]|nr:hypothetical protein [Steroidobacteraceae bacterium]